MIAHDAFSALINLSDTVIVARHLADETFLKSLISYTCVCLPCRRMIVNLTDDTTEPHISPLSVVSHAALEYLVSPQHNAHDSAAANPHH